MKTTLILTKSRPAHICTDQASKVGTYTYAFVLDQFYEILQYWKINNDQKRHTPIQCMVGYI